MSSLVHRLLRHNPLKIASLEVVHNKNTAVASLVEGIYVSLNTTSCFLTDFYQDFKFSYHSLSCYYVVRVVISYVFFSIYTDAI